MAVHVVLVGAGMLIRHVLSGLVRSVTLAPLGPPFALPWIMYYIMAWCWL